jgi:hypothetical protein
MLLLAALAAAGDHKRGQKSGKTRR